MPITFEPAHPNYRPALMSFLASFQLATEDLPGDLADFTLALDNGFLIGSAGVERVGEYGLLRSFAVHKDYQNMRIGKTLFAAALDIATNAQLQELWLITNTADRYFEKYGFERIERENVPTEITAIPQFTALCPSSAVVMRRDLNPSAL